MNVKPTDFSTTLSDFMGDAQMMHLNFKDGTDIYTARLQRLAGILAGSIDCSCQLNRQNAWQVERTQMPGLKIGSLLLQIASAPANADPVAFFDAKTAPDVAWSAHGEGVFRDSAFARAIDSENASPDVAAIRQTAAPGC